MSTGAALLLVLAGMLGIYVEFCAPGLVFPGVIGATLAVLGLHALVTLQLNPLGLALLLLGLACSGFARGAIGALLMVAGAVLLGIHWSIAIALAVPFAALTSFLLHIAARARHNKFSAPLPK